MGVPQNHSFEWNFHGFSIIKHPLYYIIYSCIFLYNGGTPIAGWFINGKSQSKMDDDWGYPPFVEATIFWLVVWNMFYVSHVLGIIIPTDFHVFQRVAQPPISIDQLRVNSQE